MKTIIFSTFFATMSMVCSSQVKADLNSKITLDPQSASFESLTVAKGVMTNKFGEKVRINQMNVLQGKMGFIGSYSFSDYSIDLEGIERTTGQYVNCHGVIQVIERSKSSLKRNDVILENGSGLVSVVANVSGFSCN